VARCLHLIGWIAVGLGNLEMSNLYYTKVCLSF
jgi:hypothetical protein